ncbi:hypothetical protein ABBQ32_011419 [Trebouxia sp. C0010 RCD-2024]
MRKGLPAAFASAAFGTFLDQKRDGEFTTAACQTVLRLITILSDSYIDTRNKSVLGQLQATFGPQFVGESPGREKSMLSLVREELLYFFQQVMTPDVCFMTLEPSLTSGESQAETGGSGRLQLAGRASKIHVCIVEGKEDWGYGGGSNPVMQLAAYYAKVLEDNWERHLSQTHCCQLLVLRCLAMDSGSMLSSILTRSVVSH